jgi:hypothetical protein
VLEEELPVFGEAAPLRVGEPRDGPALGLQDAQHRGDRRTSGDVVGARLVAEHDSEVRVGLRGETGERDRELGRAADGRDEDVDRGRGLGLGEGPSPGAGPPGTTRRGRGLAGVSGVEGLGHASPACVGVVVSGVTWVAAAPAADSRMRRTTALVECSAT